MKIGVRPLPPKHSTVLWYITKFRVNLPKAGSLRRDDKVSLRRLHSSPSQKLPESEAPASAPMVLQESRKWLWMDTNVRVQIGKGPGPDRPWQVESEALNGDTGLVSAKSRRPLGR